MCGFKAVSERQLCLMIKVARVKKSYSTSKSRITAQMCSRFRRLGGPGLRGRGGFRNGLPGLWAHGDKAEDKEWILSPSWTAGLPAQGHEGQTPGGPSASPCHQGICDH